MSPPRGNGPHQAAPHPPTSTSSRRPPIRVLGGKRHIAADAGLAALHDAGAQFFQRDKELVHIVRIKAKAADGKTIMVPAVMPVDNAALGRALGQAANWEKLKSNGETISIDPPKEVVEQIATMRNEWPFPPLRGLIATPTLRPDGTVLQKPGYDDATGYYLFEPPAMAPIPDKPTLKDAEAALTTLNDDLLTDFKFVDNVALSVAMSMLMTPVLRAAMPVVPMHVVSAPSPASGKSYLADIAAAIAIGEQCAVIAVSSKPEETEKRLIGAALAQSPIIALDNCNGLLMGDFLCQATERPLLQIRPLGTSAMIKIPNTFTPIANGNNITIGADAVRRTIQVRIDTKMEHPEERTYNANPFETVLANRGKYIRAILMIARAYIAAGMPDRKQRASYDAWSSYVRSPLIWLNWSDPVDSVASIRADDPISQQRSAVFGAWLSTLGTNGSYVTREIVKKAEDWDSLNDQYINPDLFDALLTVAKAGNKTGIDPTRLSGWIRRNLNVIALGHRIEVDRGDPARPKWRLVPA